MIPTTGSRADNPITCQVVPPSQPIPSLADDVRAGLLHPPRWLPPKYFYDDRGSQLFDRICDTPEYYPTRTEAALLGSWAQRIIALTRPRHLVELGSGTARKTRHLLDALEAVKMPATYWPFDVCEAIVKQAATELTQRYPWLGVNGLVGDYHAGLAGLPVPSGPRLFVFLGGTVGNFSSTQANEFLTDLRRCMGGDDWLLLGADRVKDPAVLHAAYNDANGYTALFNLNLLDVLNRELQADFDPTAFVHKALYNAVDEQVEMYLVAQRDQRIALPTMRTEIHLADGEQIRTEISRKFTLGRLESMLEEAGFTMEEHFEPVNNYYSLVLARPMD